MKRDLSFAERETEIVKAAVDFVKERRARINAKARRAIHMKACQEEKPCCIQKDEREGDFLDDGKLCGECVLARTAWRSMNEHSKRAGSAIRRLERLTKSLTQ